MKIYGNQPENRCDEVVEPVLHLEISPLLPPVSAEFAAATHVRHGVDHATVQEAQEVGVEAS